MAELQRQGTGKIGGATTAEEALKNIQSNSTMSDEKVKMNEKLGMNENMTSSDNMTKGTQ